jgi:signal transduction histidine kinase
MPVMNDEGSFLEQTAKELTEPARLTLEAVRELSEKLGDGAQAHGRMLQMAERGVHKVLRTAERLALIARLEGDLLVRTDSASLETLVRDAVRDALYLEGRRNIELETKLPEGSWTVRGDAEALRLGVGEAVIQAVRSARKRVTVSLEPGEAATLVVEDDGPGSARSAFVHPAEEAEGARSGAIVSLELAVRVARALELAVDTRPSTGFALTLRFAVQR